ADFAKRRRVDVVHRRGGATKKAAAFRRNPEGRAEAGRFPRRSPSTMNHIDSSLLLELTPFLLCERQGINETPHWPQHGEIGRRDGVDRNVSSRTAKLSNKVTVESV
ncbi:MAG: hypothetical protein NDJ92_20205, partial [Thermoanaerobaculia bacterium]|nr:hypothetical protein [Thermoanaerobaculia bacterium]